MEHEEEMSLENIAKRYISEQLIRMNMPTEKSVAINEFVKYVSTLPLDEQPRCNDSIESILLYVKGCLELNRPINGNAILKNYCGEPQENVNEVREREL